MTYGLSWKWDMGFNMRQKHFEDDKVCNRTAGEARRNMAGNTDIKTQSQTRNIWRYIQDCREKWANRLGRMTTLVFPTRYLIINSTVIDPCDIEGRMGLWDIPIDSRSGNRFTPSKRNKEKNTVYRQQAHTQIQVDNYFIQRIYFKI